MSDGLKLLAAIVENGAVSKLRELTQELFIDEEADAYAFISRYFRRYGRLPTFEALEDGVTAQFPEVEEPVDYYLDRVYDRKLYGELRERYSNLGDAMRSHNMATARDQIRMMSAACRLVTNDNAVSTLGEAAREVVSLYDEAHARPGVSGIPSGWETYDEATGGYQPGDLVTWVARLGVGKTNILLKQADHAWNCGYGVLVVTTEMPKPQITRRLLGIQSSIDPDLIRKGRLSHWGRARLRRLVDNLTNADRFHIFSAGMNQRVTDIDTLIVEFAPDIVFIDGAYLLRPDTGNRHLSRVERVPEVFDALKAISLAHNCPIVGTTQYSRQAGKRGKEGGIESIAFTDAIAQNSSIVLGIKDGKPPHQTSRRTIEFLKGREGEQGEFTINYQFRPVDFSEMPEDELREESASLDWMGE